ncbi:uncharacterized protein [Dermacentor albipictus]|uniref:uncharacterized protein n=1 Tax=Dermacentor albipictus TaxID=60249 RepID=UPI0031FD87D2
MLLCILLWTAASVLTPAVRGKEDGQRHPLPSSGPASSCTTSSSASEGYCATGAPEMVVTTTSSMLTASSVDDNPDGGVTAKTASVVMTSTSVTAQTGRERLTAASSTISSTASTSTSTTASAAVPAERSRVGTSSSPTVTTTTTTSTSTTTTTTTTVSSRSERQSSIGHRAADGISGTEKRLDRIDAAIGESRDALEAGHAAYSRGARKPSDTPDLGEDRECSGGGDVAHEGLCMA